MQTLIRRWVGDAAAGLSLHFLHVSEGPFLHDTGHMLLELSGLGMLYLQRLKVVVISVEELILSQTIRHSGIQGLSVFSLARVWCRVR